MRVCLITGGGYPYCRDPLGGWCRTLITGLTGHMFELVTLIDGEPPATPAYPVPANVASVRASTPTVPARRWRDGAARRRDAAAGAATAAEATAAAGLLCRGLLDEHPHPHDLFTEGLRRLATLAGDPPADAAQPDAAQPGSAQPGSSQAGRGRAGRGRAGRGQAGGATPLDGVPLAEQLLHAWQADRATARVDRLPLPRLSMRDARIAAALLRHLTRALCTPLPPADLLHCVGGTTPLLAALGAHWRSGTPLLVTEARSPAAARRPAEERLSPAVRTVLRRYRRCVTTAGYAEAGLIAPMSWYHHAWALRRGARPSRLVAVPAGVDPGEHPAHAGTPLAGERRPGDLETEGPARDATLVWTGSGGPDTGLTAVLAAFARVLAAAPGTVLHVLGIAEAERQACAERIERSGLGTAVRVPRTAADLPPGDARDGVVVHVPGPGDPPYLLIKAMMAGRPVVGVDVAAVAETLGGTGVLVAAGDPAGLAAACVALLRCPARRHELGAAARARALTHFTAEKMVRAYDALYTDLAGPPPAPAYELALAVSAPRSTLPPTVRWLAQEER